MKIMVVLLENFSGHHERVLQKLPRTWINLVIVNMRLFVGHQDRLNSSLAASGSGRRKVNYSSRDERSHGRTGGYGSRNRVE